MARATANITLIVAAIFTAAGISQGVTAGQSVFSGIQIEAIPIALPISQHTTLNIYSYSANFINDLHKGVQVDLSIIINTDSQELFHGFNGKARAAARKIIDLTFCISGVDLIVAKTFGNVHPEIAANGHGADGLGERINCDQHHGIGQFLVKIAIGSLSRVVQTQQQDVDPAFSVPGFCSGGVCL
ncbi:hypothetical protein SDC9_130258 [bioreactor metagenome]|uniref:Uncharacterized protein n=1 Tax=bioreactor metagenome TaxID=1076179 RepID=A0A645D1Z3_9ZZZZ